MLELQDLANDLKKLEYYILNSSGGFIVWECNEYLSKYLIEEKIKSYSQAIFVDILNLKRSKYLNYLNKQDNRSKKKKIFVFNNFSDAYAYGNYFDIDNLLTELNFTRDIWAKYEYIYIFILPTFLVDKIMNGSPSFWSYVSIHFRVPNIISSPLPLAKIKSSYYIDKCIDERLVSICLQNNEIVRMFKYGDNISETLLKRMINLYNISKDIDNEKILRVIFYNLSRLLSINKRFGEALVYAKKSDKIWKSSKTRINILYCELNMGYRKVHRETIYPLKAQEMYYLAVEHFAYGNFDISKRLAESYIIQSKKKNKYLFLFYELFATIFFANKQYKSAYDMYIEICFEADKIKDNYFISMDIVENNLEIVKKSLI